MAAGPLRAFAGALAIPLCLLLIGCNAAPASPASAPASVDAAVASVRSSVVPSPPPSSAPSLSEPLASPSSEPPPSSQTADETFVSKVYPYSLTLPSNVVIVVWHSAEREWNGSEGLFSDGPYNDRNGLVDGAIFIFGTHWTGPIEAFNTAVQDNVHSYHGCEPVRSTRQLSIDGAEATAWSHRCGDVLVARVSAVHGGWGLVASEQVLADHADGAIDRLAGWLESGLTWKSG